MLLELLKRNQTEIAVFVGVNVILAKLLSLTLQDLAPTEFRYSLFILSATVIAAFNAWASVRYSRWKIVFRGTLFLGLFSVLLVGSISPFSILKAVYFFARDFETYITAFLGT